MILPGNPWARIGLNTRPGLEGLLLTVSSLV